MNKRINKIKKVRQFLIEQVANLTHSQLNNIPQGYNNNIIWNLVHLISIQQALCYFKAAQKAIVPDRYITPFSINTKPVSIVGEEEIIGIKSLFISTIDALQKDYEKEIFYNYAASPNIFKVYGIEVTSIDDALEFLLYHEGYHTGYILCLKKTLN
ncbi:MAG: DinB family protein [Ferruginibacter sp.]